MITPIIIAREKPFKISPPRIKIDIKANKVVVEVITVLDKVSLIDLFEISPIFKLEYLIKFCVSFLKEDRINFFGVYY